MFAKDRDISTDGRAAERSMSDMSAGMLGWCLWLTERMDECFGVCEVRRREDEGGQGSFVRWRRWRVGHTCARRTGPTAGIDVGRCTQCRHAGIRPSVSSMIDRCCVRPSVRPSIPSVRFISWFPVPSVRRSHRPARTHTPTARQTLTCTALTLARSIHMHISIYIRIRLCPDGRCDIPSSPSVHASVASVASRRPSVPPGLAAPSGAARARRMQFRSFSTTNQPHVYE